MTSITNFKNNDFNFTFDWQKCWSKKIYKNNNRCNLIFNEFTIYRAEEAMENNEIRFLPILYS